MKKLGILVVVAIVALFAYQRLAGQKPGSQELSTEQRHIQSIEERIDAAGRRIMQASRTASVSGMDSTSDAEWALRELEKAEAEIQSLKRSSSSEEIRRECDRLMSKVEATRR